MFVYIPNDDVISDNKYFVVTLWTKAKGFYRRDAMLDYYYYDY